MSPVHYGLAISVYGWQWWLSENIKRKIIYNLICNVSNTLWNDVWVDEWGLWVRVWECPYHNEQKMSQIMMIDII